METKQLDLLVASIEEVLSGDKLSFNNILPVCLSAMQFVERLPGLKGPEKKAMVIRAIEIILEKTGLDSTLLGVIPSFIDNTISVEKGQVTISIDTDKAVSSCLGLCGKKKN